MQWSWWERSRTDREGSTSKYLKVSQASAVSYHVSHVHQLEIHFLEYYSDIRSQGAWGDSQFFSWYGSREGQPRHVADSITDAFADDIADAFANIIADVFADDIADAFTDGIADVLADSIADNLPVRA